MKKTKKGPMPGQDKKPSASRGEATRERILHAARQVFARHSFQAASVRMIGAQGGFEHGIIRYYFPSKAALFTALAEQVRDELIRKNAGWLREAARHPPAEGLSLYLERFLAYNAENPENLKIIMQNLVQEERPETIPGYGPILEMLCRTRESFLEVLPKGFPEDTVRRFTDSFNALVIFYLGAASCQARILGMDPEGATYREWVKTTLERIFQPFLEEITADYGSVP